MGRLAHQPGCGVQPSPDGHCLAVRDGEGGGKKGPVGTGFERCPCVVSRCSRSVLSGNAEVARISPSMLAARGFEQELPPPRLVQQTVGEYVAPPLHNMEAHRALLDRHR